MTAPRASRGTLLLALALVAGCGTPTAPVEGRPTMTTTPAASPTGDTGSHQARTLEILEQVYAQLETSDKPPLEKQKGPGGTAICSLDESNPSEAWVEMVYLPVESPADQVARARVWLKDEGYEQLGTRHGGTTTMHGADGYNVAVTEWPDGRVQLTVESPCFPAPNTR